VVEYLPSKREPLSSNPRTAKKKKINTPKLILAIIPGKKDRKLGLGLVIKGA
jgi:hypothetical protein